MRKLTSALAALTLLVMAAQPSLGDKAIFQDDFKDGLSGKWQVVGLKGTDYRVRDGCVFRR